MAALEMEKMESPVTGTPIADFVGSEWVIGHLRLIPNLFALLAADWIEARNYILVPLI